MGAMCKQVLPLAEIGAAGDREACRKVYLRPFLRLGSCPFGTL